MRTFPCFYFDGDDTFPSHGISSMPQQNSLNYATTSKNKRNRISLSQIRSK